MRKMNEQILLDHIRHSGPLSRADLARTSGLSKPTVGLALVNIERAGLVREAGRRTGVPGRSAVLYEVNPDAGYVLGVDVGQHYIRGAIVDLSGADRARLTVPAKASTGPGRADEVISLADSLLTAAALDRGRLTQTVVGSPGIYDPRRDALALAGGLPGWDSPSVLTKLRDALGPDLMIENDIDFAAYAEHVHGHGREVDSFAFISIGTGVGMGLVVGGQLHRGAHGAAGEIAYLPLSGGRGGNRAEARRRGEFEASASADSIVRAARRARIRGATSAQQVFSAAAAGDERAIGIVAEQAMLVARAVCAVVAVVDPELIVLGGGIGQAPGFLDAVSAELEALSPVRTPIRVSALGAEAVVDGCVAVGLGRAWELVAAMPAPPEASAAP